jgi:hypothetical protein
LKENELPVETKSLKEEAPRRRPATLKDCLKRVATELFHWKSKSLTRRDFSQIKFSISNAFSSGAQPPNENALRVA